MVEMARSIARSVCTESLPVACSNAAWSCSTAAWADTLLPSVAAFRTRMAWRDCSSLPISSFLRSKKQSIDMSSLVNGPDENRPVHSQTIYGTLQNSIPNRDRRWRLTSRPSSAALTLFIYLSCSLLCFEPSDPADFLGRAAPVPLILLPPPSSRLVPPP